MLNVWIPENINCFTLLFLEKNDTVRRNQVLYNFHECSKIILEFKNFINEENKNQTFWILGKHEEKGGNVSRFKLMKSSENNNKISFQVRNRSCYDKTTLYLMIKTQNDYKAYFCEFYLCLVLRSKNIDFEDNFYTNNSLKFYQIDSIDKSTNIKLSKTFTTVEFKIYNQKKPITRPHYLLDVPNNINLKYKYVVLFFLGTTYKIPKYKCVFCFRHFSDFKSLKKHFFLLHTHYSLHIQAGVLSIFAKIQPIVYLHLEEKEACFLSEIVNNKRKVFSILLTFRFPTLNLENLQPHYCNFFFRSREHKRSNNFIIKRRILKGFQPQTMLEKHSDVHQNDIITYIQTKKLDEIIDVTTKELDFMKKWNMFILEIRDTSEIHLKKNIVDIINKFCSKNNNDKEIFFNFLMILHKKCLLSRENIDDILNNLIKKQKGT